MSTRREARARVLQALYAFELSGDEAQHVVQNVLQPHLVNDPEARRFAERLFYTTLDHRGEADALIERHVQNWEIGRLAVLDRLVLRMAITELIVFEDVPPKVTINEAIELAKGFSTDQSGVFVNGVLDAALQTLSDEGRIQKTGRGLIASSRRRRRADAHAE
jgi:transcription antitermination protein NusB